jgi:hypothetical protein
MDFATVLDRPRNGGVVRKCDTDFMLLENFR